MSRTSLVLISLTVLLARADAAPLRVPIVGRPNCYWEAVGPKFRVTMIASRTDMYLNQTLTLTVRVQAVGKYQQPPERPRLEEVPRFKERFKIDRSASPKPERTLSDQQAWEYDYRLRPLREGVTLVPPLPFVWYRPNVNPQLRGTFFTTFAVAQVRKAMPDGRLIVADSDEIELKVKPLPVTALKPAPPIQAPEPIFELAVGSSVVRHEELLPLPSLAGLALMLLGPPTLAGAWYVVWRRFYPDAARLARIRHSRAATQAFRALDGLSAVPEAARVERLAVIVAGYLRDRLDLRSAEPTPGEVEEFLTKCRVAAEAAGRTADFFRTCDVLRFGPVANGARQLPELTAEARRLIGALEGTG